MFEIFVCKFWSTVDLWFCCLVWSLPEFFGFDVILTSLKESGRIYLRLYYLLLEFLGEFAGEVVWLWRFLWSFLCWEKFLLGSLRFFFFFNGTSPFFCISCAKICICWNIYVCWKYPNIGFHLSFIQFHLN